MMVLYHKRASLKRTTAPGILKEILGRTIGHHYKHFYKRNHYEGCGTNEDVLIYIMGCTKDGLISVGSLGTLAFLIGRTIVNLVEHG